MFSNPERDALTSRHLYSKSAPFIAGDSVGATFYKYGDRIYGLIIISIRDAACYGGCLLCGEKGGE